jgi:hypothetical protein
LIHDNAGNLYGTAAPTVFRLTPPSSQGGPWAETTLHNFSGVAGVGLFDAGLTLRPKLGNLYGVTEGGGICNRHFCNGTVFRIRP